MTFPPVTPLLVPELAHSLDVARHAGLFIGIRSRPTTQLRGAAVGLPALLRNEGGSVGTSVAQTIVERRDQFHTLRLGENLDPLNPAVNSYLDQVQPGFLQQTGDPVAAKEMALQSLANLREQQSSALAYFDTFLIFAIVAVALVVLVFFMKRSVAAKDAHVAAE
jgi:MFS transporter, DHA2 family, multidrug resistance protein